MPINCDYRAVVDVLDRHKTRDPELEAILRDVLMLQAKLNIYLVVKHVMGKCNPLADAISRVHMHKSVACINTLIQLGYKQREVEHSHYHLNHKFL